MSMSSGVIDPIAVGARAWMFSAVLRRIAQWHRDRTDVATLHGMTDRELWDIGLNRTDVQAIARGIHSANDERP